MLIIDFVAGKTLAQRASIKTKSSCHLHLHQRYQASFRVFVRLGLPFFTHCTKANVSDDQGLIEMLIDRLDYFRAKPVNIPKITILLDHGYHPNTIGDALQLFYPQIMTKIRGSTGSQTCA